MAGTKRTKTENVFLSLLWFTLAPVCIFCISNILGVMLCSMYSTEIQKTMHTAYTYVSTSGNILGYPADKKSCIINGLHIGSRQKAFDLQYKLKTFKVHLFIINVVGVGRYGVLFRKGRNQLPKKQLGQMRWLSPISWVSDE